jgi:hypothetical protein
MRVHEISLDNRKLGSAHGASHTGLIVLSAGGKLQRIQGMQVDQYSVCVDLVRSVVLLPAAFNLAWDRVCMD